MSTSLSATRRPLAIRGRADLEARRIPFRRRCYWSVKDPLSLRYFQLREEEFFVLSQLDGRTSLQEIQSRFQQRFAPRRIDIAQLNWFLATLHREGLVVANAANEGQRLAARGRRRTRQQRLGQLTNVLAIRFRGINPESLLEWLYPRCRWLFSTWCLAAGGLLMLAAALLLFAEFPTVLARLPTFRAFFDAQNIVWLAFALVVAKVLHELGHALACKHFGGECRELGVMLLVFTPCLYCNVSDAWMIRGKWQRIAISAAGIYVELVLAAICTFLWWFSEPGLLNTICLNLMFLCSISTLLFNGNPLLPYDGYFVLADLLEIPNLRQQAFEAVRNRGLRWFAGIDTRPVGTSGRECGVLTAYAIASSLYRIVLVFTILWFCHTLLKPMGLEVLAYALAVLVLGGMIAMPLWHATVSLRDPSWSRRVKWPRIVITLAFCAAAIAGCCLVRLPYHVTAPVLIEAAEASRAYVAVAGRLAESRRIGAYVERDEPIARLVNIEIEKEVEQLKGQLAEQKMHVENLKRQLVNDQLGDATGAGGQLPTAIDALVDIEKRLGQRKSEHQRLTVRAPASGVLLPPRSRGSDAPAGELVEWVGSPLDQRNQGCFLETGTEVCLVGDPNRLEAIIVVDQADIQFVTRGYRVRLQIDELPGMIIEGRVVEISRLNAESAPIELFAKRLLATKEGATDSPVLAHGAYRVRATLNPHGHSIPIRASGRARIVSRPRTLARRGYDYLRRTFRIEM